MTLLYTQLMKGMKQFIGTGVKALGVSSLYILLAVSFLGLIHFLTAPMGGIVFFSAIFTVALVGFSCAVVLFHLISKVSACFK